MKLKNTPLTALTCATLLGSAALSQAALTIGDLISVNLTGTNAETVTPTGAAVIGAGSDTWTQVVGANWNDSITSLSPIALNKTTGASSGATLTFSAGRAGGGPNTTNLDVFEGSFFLNGPDGDSSSTITLSGLGAGTKFDLYLYAAAGHTTNEGATFNFGSTQTATDTNTNETSYALGVNYVKYSNLVADGSGNISGTWAISSGANYSTLNGMQIAIVPEPSAALLGGLGMLCLLRRRRA